MAKQVEPNLNPLLLDLAADEVGQVFGEFCTQGMALISQTPDELSVRMLRARQSWAFDVTPIRERPLLEVMPGKYACPDMTLFVRAFVDRVYFLLQDAYGKETFRSLAGKLVECYLHRLVGEFAVATGPGRTYLPSPHFVGTHDEAADGILLWTRTAALIECKAGLLTTRQRLGGTIQEIFQGLRSLTSGTSDKRRKGIRQLAMNIKRLLGADGKVFCGPDTFDLSACSQIYPVLVCFDESLKLHAVQKWLQPQFDTELAELGVEPSRVGALMILTIRDMEDLSIAGQTIAVEQVFKEYAHHLASEPHDYTGSFSTFLHDRFGASIKWPQSLTFKTHCEMLRELMPRFTKAESKTSSVEEPHAGERPNDVPVKVEAKAARKKNAKRKISKQVRGKGGQSSRRSAGSQKNNKDAKNAVSAVRKVAKAVKRSQKTRMVAREGAQRASKPKHKKRSERK